MSGPTVGAGTVEDPEGGLRDGWLSTSDIGVVEADSTVRVTDRKKELILRAA